VSEIVFANRVAALFPSLKSELRKANMHYSAVAYVAKNLKVAGIYGLLFTVLFFFVLQKAGLPYILLLPIFVMLYFLLFYYSLIVVRSNIKKRERDIDKEVLFVGRYLLVKLYAGRPLLNALIETANSRGVTSVYIKEIVNDVDTGNTIEAALSSAMSYSPSDKLRKILFHINNALQLGIDVTKPLESVLQEITKEEELDIKKYGKKLNTLVIFYMLAAIIVPSLGVAMFIVISSFINFPVDLKVLLVMIFFIVVLQFIFITLFKSIRPAASL